LLDFGVVHACEWSLKNPTNANVFIYRLQGMVNANVLSELAVHIESKMIIFASGLLQGFRLLFSGKFHIQSEGGGDD